VSECCSDLAASAGLPLAATATRAERFLLLEVSERWGRDVLPESELPERAKVALETWLDADARSRVLFIRRPDRRAAGQLTVFVADVDVAAGRARRLELATFDDLADLDLDGDGEPVDGPLVLVCTHGRRDQCCARRGVAAYDALQPHLPEERLWQSSHQGGHRLAANVLVLPAGVHLGRVELADAAALSKLLLAGRIPLDHYRGRTLYSAAAQAAEVAVRHELGLDDPADVEVVAADEGRVSVRSPRGVVDVKVTEERGPAVPASCGADEEVSVRFATRLVV
jgi:hypothetical protein